MTTPARPDPVVSATIRDARRTVANDLAKSRARLTQLGQDLRAEAKHFADLTAIAEIAGITEVEHPPTADVVDANAAPAKSTPLALTG